MQSKSVQLVEVGTLKSFVQLEILKDQSYVPVADTFFSIGRILEPQSCRIVMDVLLYVRNLKKICLHIVLIMEFSKIFQDISESSNDNTNVVNAPQSQAFLLGVTSRHLVECSAQTDLIESMQNFLMKYDHIPHNEKSIKLLLAEEKFLKIKQVVEEEQTQPEYLQALLQSLLEDLQILNEIQPP
ncbi:hypothetical protein Tco_0594149 [Tanacetum coccineum]